MASPVFWKWSAKGFPGSWPCVETVDSGVGGASLAKNEAGFVGVAVARGGVGRGSMTAPNIVFSVTDDMVLSVRWKIWGSSGWCWGIDVLWQK